VSDQERYEYFDNLTRSVDDTIARISELPREKCYDADYLEKVFIPSLGLNNEMLREQPEELSEYFGKGLHLWQYPNQLSRYLVWLAHNASNVTSYMEIGCRWGGTFILVNEWLKKIGATLKFSVAVDPIEPTPFIKRYIKVSNTPVLYHQKFSSDPEFLNYVTHSKPDMVFIDGDHTMRGVMIDHAAARRVAKIIVHHDVASDACPDTSLFWSYVKLVEDGFEAADFVQQYESVRGSFLGIGVLKRKA
jgi:cephalosporin hydroxylase